MTSLRLGSTGLDVKKWQKAIGVAADGVFGSATHAATIEFQKAHNLTPDGIVGSATWSALQASWYQSTMGADATASAKGTATAADLAAYKIALRAGSGLTEAERQYTLTVARGEGYYGKGWKEGFGAGSHNWGAVQGTGPAGFFNTEDSHADGSKYVGKFKRYNSDSEGFSDMARILLKPNVKAALKRGSLKEAVYAQHSNKYFELAPEKYLSAVVRNYGKLVAGGVFKPKLTEEGGTSILSIVGTGLVIVTGAAFAYKRMKGMP